MYTIFEVVLNEEHKVLSIILHLVAITSIINSLEWLKLNQQFSDIGLNSWSIKKIRTGFNDHTFKSNILNYFFRYPNILIIFILQFLFSILILILGENVKFLQIGTLGVTFCYLLLGYRGMLGNNGADSMTRLVFTSSSIYFLFPSQWVLKLCLFFITAQLIIAYVTPGMLRLFHPKWRNGEYLRMILRLESFSYKSLWEFNVKYPKFKLLASWGLILFECGFLFVIFLPLSYLLIYLTLGIIFHTINAFVMGLNTFVWAFIGSYPALIWTSIQLKSMF